MTNQCKTWYGATRCNFEARYDLSPAMTEDATLTNATDKSVALFLDALRTKTYVHDICTACGKIVKREELK